MELPDFFELIHDKVHAVNKSQQKLNLDIYKLGWLKATSCFNEVFIPCILQSSEVDHFLKLLAFAYLLL